MQRLQVAFEVPADFLQRALAPFPLWTGEITVQAPLECVACGIMGGFFFERRIGAQRHLGGKDLRRCPCPLDICFLERDAAIGAVELVLIDESLAAAAANADTKTSKRIIEDDDFGLAPWHFERRDGRISQSHVRSRWESGKMNLALWHA